MARGAEQSVQDAVLPDIARVTRVRTETPDVTTLWLDWPAWDGCVPGQFNMVGLPGLGEIPISVSGGAADASGLMHTIRALGAVSTALTQLSAGASLTIRGPYGRPWPVGRAAGQDVIIVAGGLGLAPLRPVICHLGREREKYGDVTLIVGARGPADLAFNRDYDDWRAAGIDVILTVDHGPPGWPGRVGVVTNLIMASDRPTTAFLCGPEIMMRLAAQRLVAQGVGAEDIFVSMERNMQCGVGLCGHCQFGPLLLCRDGPVLDWATVRPLMRVEEL